MRDVMRFIEEWGFGYYVGALLVLFLMLNGASDSKSPVNAAIGLVVLGGWLLLNKQMAARGRWAQEALWLMLVGFLVSWGFSLTPNVGLNDVVAVAFGAMVFMGARKFFQDEKKVRVFFKLLMIIALAASLIGFFIYVYYPYRRFSGPFVNLNSFSEFYPNVWADFVMVALPAALYFLVGKVKKHEKMMAVTSIVLLLASLILTYSRGGWIAFLVIPLGLAAYFLLFERKALKWHKAVIKLVAVVLISVFLALSVNVYRAANGYKTLSFLGKITFTADDAEASVVERGQLFDGAWDIFKERPIVGYGPQSFQYTFPAHQQELLAFATHPHNVFLKLAAEVGLVGLVPFIIFLVLVLGAGAEGMKLKDKKKRRILVLSLLGAGALMVHHLIEYNIGFLALAMLMWVEFGIVFGCLGRRPRAVARFDVGKVVIVLVVVAGVIFAGHEGYYGWHLKKAKSLEYRDDLAALEEFKVAMNLWQVKDTPVRMMEIYEVESMHNEAVDFASEQLKSTPMYAELWHYLGEAYYDQGNFRAAGEAHLKAVELDPMNQLKYYLGLYWDFRKMNDWGRMKAWRPKMEELLDEYQALLERNAHYTVLSDNPGAAMGIAGVLGMDDRRYEIKSLYYLEREKLENPKMVK